MIGELVIPLAALIIASAALLQTSLNSVLTRRSADESRHSAEDTRRDSATKDYVQQLEKRVTACEEARKVERDDRVRLQDKVEAMVEENVHLRLSIVELKQRLGGASL